MLPANAPILRALRLPPVYAITNAAEWGTEMTLTRIERALQDGVRLIQVREKAMAKKDLHTFTEEVVVLAHGYHAKVLVNVSGGDDDLCGSAGADGVHFSSAQLMNLATRPDFEWCAASCHNAEELVRAEQLGLDFAVLAPVLPTPQSPRRRPRWAGESSPRLSANAPFQYTPSAGCAMKIYPRHGNMAPTA